MMECIFCAIVADEAPSRRVYEDEATVAFLDISPVTRGHTLVIPRRHAEDVWDVSEEDAAAVMRATWHVAQLVRRAFDPPGLNLFQATRALAGQTVFHLHVHVLPRYDAGEISIALGQRPGDPDELDSVAEEIRAASR